MYVYLIIWPHSSNIFVFKGIKILGIKNYDFFTWANTTNATYTSELKLLNGVVSFLCWTNIWGEVEKEAKTAQSSVMMLAKRQQDLSTASSLNFREAQQLHRTDICWNIN